jgi:integrase
MLVWRQHPAFYGYVFFLRWHGARPSEAAALTWDYVDLRPGIALHRGELSLREGLRAQDSRGAARHRVAPRDADDPPRPSSAPSRAGQLVFPNMDGRHIKNKTFWDIWTRCLQDCRIRHRGIYALKDTFVTHTLITAEESGEVERLTAWLVRQTGVRLDTLKQHYARWWPRDHAAIRATYALLGPDRFGAN